MASSLDPFVEMEGLRPHVRAAETLGCSLALRSLMSPPHISDGSQQIMCFIFIPLGSLPYQYQSHRFCISGTPSLFFFFVF